MALKQPRRLYPILSAAAHAVWGKRRAKDICGMVYYDKATGWFFFTHKEEHEAYYVAMCHESGRTIHRACDRCHRTRESAQASLDMLAERRDLTREPGFAGRWV